MAKLSRDSLVQFFKTQKDRFTERLGHGPFSKPSQKLKRLLRDGGLWRWKKKEAV